MLNLSIHRINVLLSVHSHWLCVMLDVIVILSHAKSIKWRTLGLVPLQRRTFITTFYNPSHKSWNTCVIFPLPNVDLGLQSFQCSKIRSEQHWGRRGAHLSENKDVKSECKKFSKNSRQMAPVSTICDEYCSLRDIPLPLPWPLRKALIYTQASSLRTTSWTDTSCTGTNIPRDTKQWTHTICR